MIIGIDGNEANIENRVGVNVYAFEMLWGIYKLQEDWSHKHSIIVYLKNKPLDDLPKETENFKYKIVKGKKLWIITALMPNLFLDSPKPNIFFTPSHYSPPFSPCSTICSIMDLGYLEFSGQFKKHDFWQLKYWSAWSIFRAKKVFAISESTKKDIVRHYKNATNKVIVTPLAYDSSKFNIKVPEIDVRQVKNKYSIKNDYILFLSTLKPSKNIEGLLTAFAQISPNFPKTTLVIAGKKGWLFDSIFEKVKKLKLENSVIFTGFIDEEDKPALIKGAKVFCLPSFWEGFGLDVLNAFACGVPVITSNRGSLPEVGAAAAIYIDPSEPASIATGLKKVLTMNKLEYNKLSKLSIAQAQKFSWQKTAKITLENLLNV